MNKKRIVYVRSEPIYNDSRATKEIESLVKGGYELVILGWNKNDDAYEKFPTVFPFIAEYHFYDCTVFGSVGTGINGFKMMFGFIHWVKKTLATIQNIDYIYACDLDAGLGAYSYSRRNRKHLIYDIYDYYIDTHNIPRFLKSMVEHLEISIINYSKTTIVCTEERKKQISKARPKQVVVIHNSPRYMKCNTNFDLEYDYIYCGSLNGDRLLEEIMELYDENSDLKVCFAGNGRLKSAIAEKADKFSNFDFQGVIPYSKVLELEKKSFCLSAVYNPELSNHKLCAPNKFYEALALGKPMIVCRGTGIDKVVEQYGLGIVINYNAEEFYRAVRNLMSNKEKCYDMAKKANKLFNEKFKWEIMEQRLLSIFREEM